MSAGRLGPGSRTVLGAGASACLTKPIELERFRASPWLWTGSHDEQAFAPAASASSHAVVDHLLASADVRSAVAAA